MFTLKLASPVPRTDSNRLSHLTPVIQAYLSRVRKQLDCRSVSYVSVNKDSHVLEVPEAACGSVPPVLLLVGQRKGFKRYSSEELKELVAVRQTREEEREAVESGVLQVRLIIWGSRSIHRVGCSADVGKVFLTSICGPGLSVSSCMVRFAALVVMAASFTHNHVLLLLVMLAAGA
jgi:hypothetical protein